MKGFEQYLQRYAVAEAREFRKPLQLKDDCLRLGRWHRVLVIPAYNESPALLENLKRYTDTLLILVLNRPDNDSDSQCNDELRSHVHGLTEEFCYPSAHSTLRRADSGSSNHILLIERPDPLPHKEAVGLARKMGCDLALALITNGVVDNSWIHCSDADATLPPDYFTASENCDSAAALTYPFEHAPPANPREKIAIELYQDYLHAYVDGLARARSPYAFHTIGSCIAVKADAYAAVRGYPRRAAGEDFYLLNKIAKQGDVQAPRCAPILLSARLSSRAPFGTGPAMKQLLDADSLESLPFFYDPRCFDGLAALLSYVQEQGAPNSKISEFSAGLRGHTELLDAIKGLGLEKFLAHAEKQCASKDAFILQFHQWLDGFRTLKLIHALSDRWPKLTAAEFALRRTHQGSVPEVQA